VLGQLGNRIQHALRAYTPRDAEAVKTAAATFRPNPKIDTEKTITELATGEALVSFLDEKGRPNPVERAWIIPPSSRIGPVNASERAELMKASLVAGTYDTAVDRESAYEVLSGRVDKKMPEAAKDVANDVAEGAADAAKEESGFLGKLGGLFGGDEPERGPRGGTIRKREGAGEALMKSAARAIGSEVGRRVIRGVLGSILGGRR
jgi:uncharacterized protein